MFYDGDLQSGIAKAVQETKLVACFVTDDGDESKLWEDEYLQGEVLKSTLLNQAVVLRLVAGSQEATYLAAIYPLPKTPTLVIIKNGDLKEYIASGVSKEEFHRRIAAALPALSPINMSHSIAPASTTTPQTAGAQPSRAHQPSATAPQFSSSTQQGSGVVQDMLAERAARLEVDKKKKEAAAKAERIAAAKARKAEIEDESPSNSRKAADMKYALLQKKRQQEARAERERILKRVEDDKVERREREAQRKAQARFIEEAEKGGEEAVATSSILQPISTYNHTHCALQVRLFDGSTIRSRFPANGSLRANVRPWIEEQQIEDTPYTFKQVLTPFPNKNISVADEEKSLQSQGLAPSSTLILVPVQSYTSAYGGDNVVSRAASGAYGLVSSGVGRVTGVLGSFLGGGSAAASPSLERSSNPAAINTNSAINVRTLGDHDREDQQFYNGNALNFQPREDSDKKED